MTNADIPSPSASASYDMLGTMVDGIVSQVMARHYRAPTQEPQLTAKIAQELEGKLNGLIVNGHTVQVWLQDFDSSGRDSRESRSGADLYISVERTRGSRTVTKGMLVQAKWDYTAKGPKLDDEASTMLDKTKASYVWIYQPTGIAVVPAQQIVDDTFETTPPMTVGTLIAEGLKCTQGDPEKGRSPSLPPVEGIIQRMDELSVRRGLALMVEG